MKNIVVASNNPSKIKEYKAILGPLGYSVFSLKEAGISEDPEETADSYEGNALIKAKAAAEKTPFPVIADDSGIEIKAFGEHFPGILSGRWAKGISQDYREVRRFILERMKNAEDRGAEYICVICLIEKGRDPRFFKGVCKGKIMEGEHGDNGFAYDPIFQDLEGRDFGLIPDGDKNAISHRGKAASALASYLGIENASK
jgi:XTP/dITP diphosphohydrolase